MRGCTPTGGIGPLRGRRTSVSAPGLGLALGLGLVLIAGSATRGADHREAPGAIADAAADIADFYAWHQADKLVTAITFAGLAAPGQAAAYDADLLYEIHIDRDDDNVTDHDILIRFGQNRAGAWGVQVENLPGAAGTVSGPVNTTIDAGNGNMVFAGQREDPFFFDLEGFQATLADSTLSFDNARDSFAGLNVTAIVLEMDRAAALGGGGSGSLWATTGRK